KRREPLALIVPQKEPAERAGEKGRQQQPRPVLPPHPSEIPPHEQHPQESQGQAPVRLKIHESERHDDYREELEESRRAESPIQIACRAVRSGFRPPRVEEATRMRPIERSPRTARKSVMSMRRL